MAEAIRSKPRKHKTKQTKPPQKEAVAVDEYHSFDCDLGDTEQEIGDPFDYRKFNINEQSGSVEDESSSDGTKLESSNEKEKEIKGENVSQISKEEESAINITQISNNPVVTHQDKDIEINEQTDQEVIENNSEISGQTRSYDHKQEHSETSVSHSLVQRPQTLPDISSTTTTMVSTPQEATTGQTSSKESSRGRVQTLGSDSRNTTSLAAHMTQFQNTTSPTSHSGSHPMTVVEDPNTPMARAQSPVSRPEQRNRVSSPTVPTLVQEEKSPSLLAQEALARMQALTIDQSSPKITSQSLPQLDSVNPLSPQQSPHPTSVDQTPSVGEHPSQSHMPKQASAPELDDNTHVKSIETESSRHQEKGKVKSLFPQELLDKEKERSKPKLGAMAISELLQLYYNPQLAHNERFVDEFIHNENMKENHEFAEILSNYFRTRHQLISIEEDVRTLQRNYSALQKEVWITHIKTLMVQGQCGDQAKVTTSHSYEQCQLNTEAVAQMKHTLETIRKQIADNLSLFAYSAQISRLQVESYIHDLYMSCPVLRDIPKNAPVQARHLLAPDEEAQIKRLKDCISILFLFHRKPTKDAEFISNIRQWTVRLTSSLLRLATFSEHLFVLNHLLRCPSGVGRWGSDLVQCPSLGPSQHQATFGCPTLNHVVTCMATLLLPVRAREEFMCHMRINLTQDSIQEERTWILVDSDGEEDEDPSNAWLYLHENDIVAFLNQLPLAQVFAHVLMASVSDTGAVDYEIRRSTEPMMMRLLAFCTVLIQIMGAGLSTYSMARYRQLNRRLGRLIRQTVSFASDHWLNYKVYYGPLASQTSMDSLQAEFDQLFMRATYSILSAHMLGSWQFMADMPFTCVSSASMWQLLWVLHQGQGQDPPINLDLLPPVEECKKYLQDPDSWQQLSDNLLRMPTSEAIYLLTTFANMAACRGGEEEAFIHTITLEVFEIAYICNHTREFCSKVGRELLSGIIQTHPAALSYLLARVKEVLKKLGKMSLYLFSELPDSIWQPTDPDMLILRQWLLNFDLMSSENQLARTILEKVNWDVFEQTGRLVVDIRLHRQVALLLVEAYTRFIADKRAGFFIMEGMKQMASYISSALTPEQVFNNWVWDLALRLKLHQQSVLLHAYGTVDLEFRPPVLGSDTWLLPLLKGTSNKTPIACFVALTMTNIGHDVSQFISEGLDLLSVLTNSGQYTTAIHVLGCVFPLFVDCQQYLLENGTFLQIVQNLLGADESLLKATKSAIMAVEFPGIITQQLTEMIQALVSSHLMQGKADQVITFWIKVIFKVCKFFTDKNSCFVADTLIQWCFVKKGVLDVVADIFQDNYKKFCQYCRTQQGIVSSVMSWISQAHTLPSYMDGGSLAQFPWLAYLVLCTEGDLEVNSRLWQSLTVELLSPGRPGVDNALKVAVTKLGLDQYPSGPRLTIYRWAQQALDTPHDHPLLPVIWQRFFALYLGRQVFEASIAQRASVGERFFESLTYSHMLKKMRRRLVETSDFHMNFDPHQQKPGKKRPSTSSPSTSTGGGVEEAGSEDDSPEYTSSVEFHQMLARLFQTFSLWLEEPRLHDANLYLPALPPQYEGARLNQVFQGFMGPWLEFMDLEGIQYTLSCMAADWRKRLTCVGSATAAVWTVRRNTITEPENATERITRRLRRYDPPNPPPTLQAIQSAVPLISTAIVEDREALMHLVDSDLQVLLHFTQLFSSRSAQHCALDNAYLEMIPSLYANIAKTIQLTVECKSKMNPLHKCTNPAVIPVKLEVKELNELTQRKLDENRVEYKQVMIESLLPTAPNICVAAVHTENAITLLIKQSQQCRDPSRQKHLLEIASGLFYKLADLITEEVNFYPPTRQFFASCIEILGQEFVSRDPGQTDRVLQLCLDKPWVSGLVSPHFTPNSNPGQLGPMYGQLLHVLQAHNLDLVFMLLTKFDIRQWLASHSPSESERKQFVASLGSAIMACGAEPGADSKLVFGLYLSHLCGVLESNFPANLYLVFNMVLQGSSADRIHVKVWESLLQSCLLSPSGGSRDPSTFSVEQVQACSDIALSTGQVKELLDWLSSFFLHAKMSGGDKEKNFGLYTVWSRYIPYLAMLMGALTRSFITKVLNGSEELQPMQIVEIVWQPMTSVFSVWLQPFMLQDGSVTSPWTEPDDTLAVMMVAALRQSIQHLYTLMAAKHPNAASGVLSMCLMYYTTGLCNKYTPAHLVSVYAEELKQLPWDQLWPDLQLLEAMTKVKEISSPCCFIPIGQILPQVKWRDVIGHSNTNLHPELANRMQALLAVLLIQACVDPVFCEDPQLCAVLQEALTFDWSRVTVEGYTCVCSWFMQLCDPKCVLAQRTSNLGLGIRLLKQISGFSPDAVWTDAVSVKRLHCAHCISQQLCQVTYVTSTDPDTLSTAIVNFVSEIEAVETSIPCREAQSEESLNLLKEVLSLLNNSNPEGPWQASILSSLTGWLASSPQSQLLVPCMRASMRCLASLRQMAAVMEAALLAYFSGMEDQSEAATKGWDYILSFFQVPELNQAGYVQDALSENGFLVLYAFLRFRLPFYADDGMKEQALMEEILDWTSRAQPNCEDEAKLILWWAVLLQLARQAVARPGRSLTGVINVLVRLSQNLGQMGQDRASHGLLGAIGLGAKSQLSIRMRLLSRALSAFLSSQLVSSDIVRTNPGTKPSQSSTLGELRALRRNKSYHKLNHVLDHAVGFVQDSNHTIHDCLRFLGHLVKDLYHDKKYLRVVEEMV